jgi:hypothetical protein
MKFSNVQSKMKLEMDKFNERFIGKEFSTLKHNEAVFFLWSLSD